MNQSLLDYCKNNPIPISDPYTDNQSRWDKVALTLDASSNYNQISESVIHHLGFVNVLRVQNGTSTIETLGNQSTTIN